ncbi:hypothetical protein D3C73_1413190 [compost metagenome]
MGVEDIETKGPVGFLRDRTAADFMIFILILDACLAAHFLSYSINPVPPVQGSINIRQILQRIQLVHLIQPLHKVFKMHGRAQIGILIFSQRNLEQAVLA